MDEKNNYVCLHGVAENATQLYLYRVRLSGKGSLEKMTPASETGVHEYDICPTGHYALHTYSNANTPEKQDWVDLPEHKMLAQATGDNMGNVPEAKKVEFFKVHTQDGVEMDGWMVKPVPFDDSTKKYPVVFFVYGDTAADGWNAQHGK